MDNRSVSQPLGKLRCTALQNTVDCVTVDQHEKNCPGSSEQVARVARDFRPCGFQRQRLGACAIPHQEVRTRLRKIERHRFAHTSWADKADGYRLVLIFDAFGRRGPGMRRGKRQVSHRSCCENSASYAPDRQNQQRVLRGGADDPT
jgi:hypothetical protein